MSKKILVLAMDVFTDENQQQLTDAGFELTSCDINQEEIIKNVHDVDGMLIGGWNNGTKAVFDAAPKLKIVVFPGIGFQKSIPDWEYAVEKGIAVANTPDAPTQATAEWSMLAALAMTRGLFVIGRTGTTGGEKEMLGLENRRVGIFALGRIGKRLADMLQPFRPASISYFSTNRHPEEESVHGLEFVDENTLFAESDIVFIAAPDIIGSQYFNDERLSKLKSGSLVVSISRNALFDFDAVRAALKRGVMWAQDDPVDELEQDFGPEQWFTNHGHNAYNTIAGVRAMGDASTEILIKFFETGEVINDVTS